MSEIDPAVSKDRARRRIRRSGNEAPYPGAPPIVVWRASGCRHIVLTVYLNPAGWHIDGRPFKVPVDEWAQRTAGDDAAEVRSGEIATFARDRRRINGLQRDMPLDLDEWVHGRFEIGCDDGHGWAETRDLADDCRRAKETREPVKRVVVW